jgi:hypothetical protein
MSSIVMISTSGLKSYISDQEIANAYKELLAVDYSPVEASELALSICIARHELDSLDVTDLLYSKSDFTPELLALATLNSKVQYKCNQTTLVTT